MRVTVLTGGTSSERDVAIASAVQVIGALRSRGHEVAVVDTARGYIPEADEPPLSPGRRDGAAPDRRSSKPWSTGLLLSGLANLPPCGTPTCCSLHFMEAGARTEPCRPCSKWWACPTPAAAALGSAMAMDKDISKRLFRAAGVPTAGWVMAPVAGPSGPRVWMAGGGEALQTGVHGRAYGGEAGRGYEAAVALARRYDDEVMIEGSFPAGS